MPKRLNFILALTAPLAMLAASPAAADTSCRQAMSQYNSKYEPLISKFYNMTDREAQCRLAEERRRELKNFATALKGACAGTTTENIRNARDDLETFALTALNICGPQ